MRSAWRYLSFLHTLRYFAFMFAVVLGFGTQAVAQDIAGLEQGLKPYGSYHGGDIDSVSMVNGSLTVHIPLISYPQRGGKLHVGYSIVYNTPSLHLNPLIQFNCVGNANICYPRLANYQSTSGWESGLSFVQDFFPGVVSNYANLNMAPCAAPGTHDSGEGTCVTTEPLFEDYSVIDYDLANHHMGQTSTSSWLSRDATGYAVNSAVTSVNAMLNGTVTPINALVLIDRNGTRYSYMALPAPTETTSSGTIQVGPSTWGMPLRIEDTNGNFITANYTSSVVDGTTIYTQTGWTDSVGRTIPVLTGWGFGNWNLPGPNGGVSTYVVSGTSGSFPFPNAPVAQYLSPCTSMSQSFCGTSGYGVPKMLQSVALPDGTAYTFSYDPTYGTLSQITFPTGGTISYTWTASNTCTGPAPFDVYPTYSFLVTSRTVNANDGTGPHTWNYTYSTLNDVNYPTSYTTTVTDPLGNDTVHTMTTLGQACVNIYETESDRYAGLSANGNLIEKTATNYASTPDPYGFVNGSGYSYQGGIFGTVMNVVPTSITTTDVASGKTSQTTTKYDAGIPLDATYPPTGTAIYGNVIQENEYDYGTTSGTPGALLRTTKTAYMALSGPNSSQYLANNMLSSPYTVQVLNGTGVQASFTQYNYDEATPTASGLAAAQQLDTAPPAGTYRGNNTSVLRWLNSGSLTCPNGKSGGSGSNVILNNTYFNTGTVNSASDPCGDTTTYAYSSTYNDAFPTTVTNALGQSSSFSYDFNIGLKTSATDPNKQTTTYGYDSSWRLTSVTHPDSGSLGYCYSTSSSVLCSGAVTAPSVLLTKTMNSSGQKEQMEADVDGLGRTIKEHVLSDPDGVDMTDTTYDALGRVQSVSNPYRTATDPTYGITSYQYDALSRKLYEYRPDNSYLAWGYNGNMVTFQDEVGNRWQRTSDALGRLTKVLEPNGSSTTPSMVTNYTYDALSNLLTVAQAGVTGIDTPRPNRTFTYDSLSRLLTAYDLESGTEGYTYDPIGNVVSKTSPLVNASSGTQTIGYCYDGLNRVTYKFYSAPPSSCTSPTGYSASYSFDTSSLPGASNDVGRLTDEKAYIGSTLISERSPYKYDSMGKLQGEQQIPYSPSTTAYQFLYDYDWTGNVNCANNGYATVSSSSDCNTSFTALGSSIREQYSYDAAGRLKQANTATQPSSWNTTAYPTLLLQASGSSPASYDPLGHLVSAQLGIPSSTLVPAIQITRQYDNRGRVVSEVDGGNTVSSAATSGVGSITVSGTEAGPLTLRATSGKGSLTITGTDGTHQVCSYIPSLRTNLCLDVPDTGTLSVTIDGFTGTASYADGSTDANVAQLLTASFNVSGSPATAVQNGASVTLTAIASGTASNYPITISNGGGYTISDPNTALVGGKNAVPNLYDAGTSTVTITNNAVTPAVNYTTTAVHWGQGDTDSTVATHLAAAINTAAGSVVTVTTDGGTVSLVAKAGGTGSDYTVSTSIADTQTVSYPTLFPSPSFSADSINLAGGEPAESSYGTIYSYQVPSGGYAPNGNLLQSVDSVMGAWNYGYDTLNRLAAAQNLAVTSVSSQFAGLSGCWSYDGFGNRKVEALSSVTGTPCASNANDNLGLTSRLYTANNQDTGFLYDGAGNVRNDGMNQYLYDPEGRICAVAYPNGSGGNYYEQYFYDAEGTRVGKTAATSLSCAAPTSAPATQYLLGLNGEQVTELSVSGTTVTPQHTNIFAGSKLLATYDLTGTVGLHFALADPLGTKRVQVSAAGTPEWNCLSLPFSNGLGNLRTTDCVPVGTGAPDATEHHFTQHERDTESGNDYFGARYYAGSMGRFMSPDPTFYSALSANPQTWNRYSYALNTPLTIIDPNGELWQRNSNGGWDWGTWCPIGATCVTQIAQQEGDNVVTYGPSSANDKQSFSANKQGYVNVADIAATDGAYFELKSGAHSYASPQTAVDLYNGAFDYHLTYPNDSKLFVTDIGKSDGSNFKPHKTHNLGRSVDFRYMDSDGKPIASDRKLAAIWYADDSRMETMVNIFKENGFNQNYSDNDKVYGTSWAGGHDTHIHFGKTSHLGQCEIGPCK